MITREVFAQHMAALCDRFNRTMAPPAMAIYYEMLGQHMSDVEFRGAIRLAFNRQFFPSPQDIYALAHPAADFSIEAADEYTRVLGACSRLGWQRAAAEGEFTITTRKAILAAGGMRAMALAEPHDEPHVRRRFIDHYEGTALAAMAEQHAAVIAELDPRAGQLVTDVAKRIGVAKEP